jgi:hypothetical protein
MWSLAFCFLNGSIIHERNGDSVIAQCLFWDMINDFPTRIGYFARSRETLSRQCQQNLMHDVKLFYQLVTAGYFH